MGIHLLQVEGSKELVTQAQYTKDNLNGKISFKDGSLVVSVPLQTVKDDLIATPTDNYSLVVKKYVDQQISSVNANVNAIPAVTASATQTTGTTIGTVTIGQDTVTYKVDLSALAPLASPALTGAPTAPTQAASTNNTTIATTAFVQASKNSILDSVGTTLNTLKKIAAAINNDASYYQTVNTALDTKLNTADLVITPSSTTGTNVGTIKIGDTTYTFKINLSSYAPLKNPTLTGTPKAPTAAKGTNTEQIATTAFVHNAVSDLISAAPEALDTLKELGDALGNDPNFATTISTALGLKQPLNAALTSISGLSTAANNIIYTTAKDTYAVTPVTDHGRSLLNTADAAATRSLISAPSTTGEGASGTWNITATQATTAATTTGNAGTATTLKTPRTISISDNSGTNTATGTSFNGSEDITLKMPATIKGALDGNAATATKLNSAVNINIADAGGVNTGLSTTFDGSKNVTVKLPSTIAANLTGTASNATADAEGNVIDTTYETKANAVTGLSVSGRTVTYTKGDGTTGTLTTQDTNTLMTQNVSAADNTYPVLAVATANATANLGAKAAIFSKDIKVNPKTGIVFANTFSGDLEGTADQAIADADGNDISDTYETKANAITGLSVSGRVITYTKGNGNTGTITTQDTGDTHWTTKLIVGNATDSVNAATTNGNTNLRLFDNNTARSTVKLTGSGATTVTSDAAGAITVNSNNNAVTQTNTTANASYAILLKKNNTTSTATDGTLFNTGVYVNPSTKTVKADIFDGRATDAAQADNVTGTVAIANGGTGLTSSPSMLTNLASTAADNILKASPRPGVTGTLPVANGGTGQTSLAQVEGIGSALMVRNTVAAGQIGTLVYSTVATNDRFRIAVGGNSDAGWGEIATADGGTEPIYVRQYTGNFETVKNSVTLLDGSGNTTFPNTVTAPTFSGYLSGIAEQANKDSAGNNIVSTYETKANAITSLGISGHTLTYGKGDNTSATLTLPDENTHWTSRLYVGAENSSVKAATTNGNTFITVTDDNTARNSVKIVGSGSTSVTSNNANVITVSSTDQKMTQTNSTANASYAILLKKNNTTTAETADAYFSTNVYVNPSTKTITAATFSGNATSATKATQDGDGKTITSTYAKLTGADFTGTVTAPTATAGTNTTQVATTAFVKTAVDTAVTNLLGSAPAALDTLNELAAALGNDANFSTTITTALAGKQPLHAALTSISGLTTAANKMIYTTAANTYAVTTLTATARSLLDDADVATMRTTLSVPARDGTGASGTWAINISGNATTATKAAQDADGKVIADTYETKANAVTNITADGRTVTFHKGDGTTGTFTTQDTNTDTHWTSKLILGATTSTVNASTTNGNTALRLFDNSTARNTITIKGTGATSVTSDAAGVMTVSSTDQKVAQNVSTDNNTYPVLISGTANATANVGAAAVLFASGVKVNPSTSTITATTFNGNATTATTAGNVTGVVAVANGGTGHTALSAVTGIGSALKVQATVANDTVGELVRGTMGTNDYFRIAVGGGSNAGWAEIATADDNNEPVYVRQYKGQFVTLVRTATLLDDLGNTEFPGTVTAPNFSGLASKATADANGNDITTTYETKANAITGLSVSGKVITYTKGNGTTGTITTQDTNDHYTTHLYAGASDGVANAATTNGATHLILTDNTTARNRIKITGSGATTVTSDANGNITISSTDTNTNTDTLVTQNVSTTDATYPILATPTANATANQGAKTAIFGSNVKLNPKTGTVIATNFTGLASKATADASGNTITTTYATKAQAVTSFAVSGTTVTFTRADGTTGTFVTQDTNTNTDTLMTQNVSTTDNTYPILLVAAANATANQGAKTAIFGSGVKVNPKTSAVSATYFDGRVRGTTNATTYVSAAAYGNALVNNNTANFSAIFNSPTKNYRVALCTWDGSSDDLWLYSVSKKNVEAGTNTRKASLVWNADTGILTSTFKGNLTGNVTGNVSGSSGSCTGNAATATKFASEQAVTLTGDITGTASSQAGWTISTKRRATVVGNGNSPNADYQWYKVASVTTSGSNQDKAILFHVFRQSHTDWYGILSCYVRTNNAGTGVGLAQLQWKECMGFDPTHFEIAYDGHNVTLWTKIVGGSTRRIFIVIGENSNSALDNYWTLHDTQNDKGDATEPTGTRVVSTLSTASKMSAANVTGTVDIEHGGTGQTTLPKARQALFGDNMNTAALAQFVITVNSNHANGGYTSIQQLRNFMGLGNTTGALPVANGGTGLTASPSMLTNLASTTAANVLAASPRPGVTGTLGVANGGTGQTSLANVTVGAATKATQDSDGKAINTTYAKLAGAAFTGNVTGTTATLTGTLTLSKTTDLSGTANNSPALIVGGAATSNHMEFDCNEIQAKATGTTVTQLYLNNDGGLVNIGTGGLKVNGNIDATGKTVTATTFSGKATSAGTADSAAKFTAAQSITLTGAVTGAVSSQAGWTIDTVKRHTQVGFSGAVPSSPGYWSKVAYYEIGTEVNRNPQITFLVENVFGAYRCATLYINVRKGNPAWGDIYFILKDVSYYNPEDFVLVLTDNYTVELWFKVPNVGWNTTVFTVLSEGYDSTFNNKRWTLCGQRQSNNEVTIPTTGTQVTATMNNSNVLSYTTCSTAAATAAKTVTLAGFVLVTGSRLTVKFTVTNTAANPTLNVSSTGAKAIYYRGAAVPAAALQANSTYDLVYNGTQYEIIGSLVWGS